MQLGDRLREIRTQRGLRLIDVTSQTRLSASFLSDIERGKNAPSMETLVKLADYYGMSLLDLLAGVEDDGSKTDASLPPGLAELRKERDDLTNEWLSTLSRIEFRGQRIRSKDEWLELFLHLKRLLPHDGRDR